MKEENKDKLSIRAHYDFKFDLPEDVPLVDCEGNSVKLSEVATIEELRDDDKMNEIMDEYMVDTDALIAKHVVPNNFDFDAPYYTSCGVDCKVYNESIEGEHATFF